MTAFEVALKERLPFLQNTEESLRGRTPVICTDLSRVGSKITTPTCLQHVGMQIVETAEADWTGAQGLSTVVAYLGDLLDLWETVFQRHREAVAVFANAAKQPYCLFLLSFSGVTHPIEVPGARAVLYMNEPHLPANLATTLMTEADWLRPVCCLHTDDMQLLVRAGPSMPAFRVHTIRWQDILDDAIASASTVLFYVDGSSPGVQFELESVHRHGLDPHTVIVHTGARAPEFDRDRDYAAVMPIDTFLAGEKNKETKETGPGKLSRTAKSLLKSLAADAKAGRTPSSRLMDMPCDIVDAGMPAGFDEVDPETSYFVTPKNAAAFVGYVQNLPDSMLRWNAISQDIRLRGIQPSLDDFNALYLALRMAFVSAACLGFTGSIALTTGLLCKVASMAKPNKAENPLRIERYMRVLDLATRFDALTERRAWTEKIQAFRESILEDPFM
jgi:hypothetical protein